MAGIPIADNFNIQMQKPLDGRITYSTLSSMKSQADTSIYDGCLAYCSEDDKYYKFLSTNTVDPDTGKWREFSSGGGGTTYTAGDGIDISNGEISTDNLQSGDMDDIVTPLPSVRGKYHKYSTEEQIVGEWIDGSPVYERTVTKASLSVGDNRIEYSIPNFGRFIEGNGSALRGGTKYVPINHASQSSDPEWALAFNDINGTELYVEVGGKYTSSYVLTDCAITIRYTKTTT